MIMGCPECEAPLESREIMASLPECEWDWAGWDAEVGLGLGRWV